MLRVASYWAGEKNPKADPNNPWLQTRWETLCADGIVKRLVMGPDECEAARLALDGLLSKDVANTRVRSQSPGSCYDRRIFSIFFPLASSSTSLSM